MCSAAVATAAAVVLHQAQVPGMAATRASDYSRPLQNMLAEAGMQGSVQAGAFKTLLEFVCDVQGDLGVLGTILEQLKSSEKLLQINHQCSWRLALDVPSACWA